MSGEVAELDISGRRQQDPDRQGSSAPMRPGNDLYDLFMHIGTAIPHSVAVADTPHGASPTTG